jgi:enterochelin esterase-like enzyme
MKKKLSLGRALVAGLWLLVGLTTNVHGAVTPVPGAKNPARPVPPTRAPDGPGAPRFTVVTGPVGTNPPVNVAGDFVIGPNYVPAPEVAECAGVPHGRVQQFTLESSESGFYPGIGRDAFGTVDPINPRTLMVTTRPAPYRRTVTVYVPSQYVSGTASPFIVVHDGPALGKPDRTLPRVLDNLIAQERVPVQIAIMIAHGGGDAQGSERGLEYDTMSGRYAEFIQAEVLPEVEKRCGVILTKDPEGRATMGNSSGGAAALIMAWYHPEWYRRVVTYSGTFVNQQWPSNPETPGGAWEFHATLIPQSERKPLRLWIQVGDRDLYNPNVLRDGMHDWVEANHRMAAVLKAKGYPYQYVFAQNAGHSDQQVREQTLPQALEWIWRGYQAPLSTN